MQKKDKNLGIRHGRLLVLRFDESRTPSGHKKYQMICDCGAIVTKPLSVVKIGDIRSCGCLARELSASRKFKHGLIGTKEYAAWTGMRARCLNPKKKTFKYYGGRGISICARWGSFEKFLKDMGPAPGKEYSIDRINVNGNYDPGNCRWATKKEQSENRRRSIFIEFFGEKRSLVYWCKFFSINYFTARNRLRRGLPPEKIFKAIYETKRELSP